MWRQNLIVLDEEDEAVQFAHHTVKRYFLEDLPSQFDEFHFQFTDADHEAGEICVTYLNFNDFKTQLIRRPKPQPPITPGAIVETALLQGSNSIGVTSLLRSVVAGRPRKTSTVDAARKLASYGGSSNESSPEKLPLEHPFLGYASANWLLHTTAFEDGKSKTWNSWTRMLSDEQSFGQTPWSRQQFIDRDREVGLWICEENHGALLRFIESSDKPFSEEDGAYLVEHISAKDNLALLKIFLEMGHLSAWNLNAPLEAAAKEGDLEIVEKLLAASPYPGCDGPSAMHVAARGDHRKLLERLLATGSDVNAPVSGDHWTPLQAAAERGHSEIVARLLAAGADVNVPTTASNSSTALQIAASGGHLEVVERLLAAEADVNADSWGRTALHVVAKTGNVEIADRLLAAKATANTMDQQCWTPLHSAAEGDNFEIVERLLAAGADVNAAGHDNWTALHLAAKSGYLETVQRLMAAKADVNAATRSGDTALRKAVRGGHREVVALLRSAGASR